MIHKIDAITALDSNARVSCNEDTGETIWYNENKLKLTEEQIQAKIAELQALEPMRLLRLERNRRLAETDWRATVDYPGTDKQLWLDYRQILRDLPATADPQLDERGNLVNVTWPEVPE